MQHHHTASVLIMACVTIAIIAWLACRWVMNEARELDKIEEDHNGPYTKDKLGGWNDS